MVAASGLLAGAGGAGAVGGLWLLGWALLVELSLPWLRRGHAALVRDPAALLLVQAAFVAMGALGAALVASWAVTSVFLARYLWPELPRQRWQGLGLAAAWP